MYAVTNGFPIGLSFFGRDGLQSVQKANTVHLNWNKPIPEPGQKTVCDDELVAASISIAIQFAKRH